MDAHNDPFPLSLPQFDQPRVFGEDMNDAIGEGGLDFVSMTFGSPENHPYWDDATSYQSPAKSNGNNASAPRIAMMETSQSPQSSLPDSSSSDSSNNRHRRNHSSDSSQIGALGADGDIQMIGNTSAPNGILIGADPAENRVNDQPFPATDVDVSNRAMESHFDFDSAASSPSPHSYPTSTFNNSRLTASIQIPYRSSQKAGSGHGPGPYSGALKGSRETSPQFSAMRNQDSWSPVACYTPQSSMNYSGQYISGAQLSGSPQAPDWQYPVTTVSTTQTFPSQSTMFPQPAMAAPYVSPAAPPAPAYAPNLHVGPLPPKSRVETQIPVKLTLYSPPLGITKLHLQTYTMSKSKLVAKPTPEKALDMLELHAMLVCTSAMHDPVKRKRAVDKAIELSYAVKREERRSSSGDVTTKEYEENKPLNGGPVKICMGCIERERKRAARKKTKNIEEEQLWQKDEAKRIIVFNIPEVKEWQQPSPLKNGENVQSDSAYTDLIFHENALQVDIPMRIACYCRHQEEKEGFQVIFTLRDYQDNFVAQTFTDPIVITDDHKTHTGTGMPPPQNVILPDTTQFGGAGFPLQGVNGAHARTQFRHAFSTTDLQGMQQQQFSAQPNKPFATPHNTSQTTSATLTPKSLSRQASPSASSGPQCKKRKTSTSGRIRNDLTMTKLQTTPATGLPDTGILSTAQVVGPGPGAIPYGTDYASPQGSSMTSQFNTGPTTPSTADSSFFSSAQRSQSMENLPGYQGMFSAPTSVRPSRAPSPTAAPYSNGLPHTHAQSLTNSLHSVQPQRSPVIHKLTPGEGPKSGGIEVTCLGSGFRVGLEVMFGDAQATTTTYWGESALVCLVPPAIQAGSVPVTIKHNYTQRIPSPPNKQVFFRYIDDEEQELMKHALALVNSKFYGIAPDSSDSARRIISQLEDNAQFLGGSNYGSSQQRQVHSSIATTSGTANLETTMLSCLNLVDLDDSPYPAAINAQGTGGQSMLHISASLGYYRLVAGLLARGANPDLRDNNGMSPMHMASLREHLQVIRKLRSAGGDPTLRSLNGFTPADMATSQQTHDASNAVDHHHTRSKSAGATPVSYLSRSSSMRSVKSFGGAHSRIASAGAGSNFIDVEESDEEGVVGRYKSQPVTPAQAWARSRRNSLITEQQYSKDQSQGALTSDASSLAMNPAWRDQLLAQVQQLQHSLQRTLPNLQIPTLPPIPNLPDYQAVRKISSLVPQRNPRPSTADGSIGTTKDADYRWWELFSGSSSPPPYEEIYPEKTHQNPNDKKTSALLAAGEAFMDQKCELNFDRIESSSVMESVNLGSDSFTREQKAQLREAYARKVKKLRSDRNLFFIWLPLLFLVLMMMLKDRVPQCLKAAGQAIRYARDRFHERAVEVV